MDTLFCTISVLPGGFNLVSLSNNVIVEGTAFRSSDCEKAVESREDSFSITPGIGLTTLLTADTDPTTLDLTVLF